MTVVVGTGAATAAAKAQVWPVSLSIKSSLFMTWADVAEEHLKRARRARAHPPARDALGAEIRAALVAICAVAFSLEALNRELRAHGGWSLPTAPKGKSSPSASAVLRDALHKSIALDPAAVAALARRATPVILARDKAVHFQGVAHAPVPHPSGTHSSIEAALYSLEEAEKAVALMRETFRAVADHPRPAVAQFAKSHRSFLRRRRR